MVTRLLLGFCESGFIPAGLYTITRWYKKDETSKRFSWFFIGNMLAQAVSGLLAYGILHMRGNCWAGWVAVAVYHRGVVYTRRRHNLCSSVSYQHC